MERAELPSQFQYRAFSASRASKIQEEIGLAAKEGFRVVGLTSGQKDIPGTGFSIVPTMTNLDVLVVLERMSSN